MARFNKVYTKKLFLPDGKIKGQNNEMSLLTVTASELNILDGVTSTASELNILDGVTSTYKELNLVDNMWNSVTTTAVDNEDGTASVQFVFKDAAGVTMATPVAGQFYLSEVATGLTADAADTSIAALTNGVVNIVDTDAAIYYNYITTAAGLLGLTITSNDDSYWIVFVHPTGKLVISDEITVTAGG